MKTTRYLSSTPPPPKKNFGGGGGGGFFKKKKKKPPSNNATKEAKIEHALISENNALFSSTGNQKNQKKGGEGDIFFVFTCLPPSPSLLRRAFHPATPNRGEGGNLTPPPLGA